MATRRMYGLCLALTALIAVGCSQAPMDPSSMKPPERPKELDKLESWVGSWTGSGDCKMTGVEKPCKMNSTNTISWDCDKRILVEHMEGEMEGMGKMTAMGVYTWDSDAKKFRTYWFDSMGSVGEGWMGWCDKCNCWCMTGKGKDPMTGQATVGEGCMKMVDNNTLEWCWTEWDGWKWNKKMEMKGTSKRRS